MDTLEQNIRQIEQTPLLAIGGEYWQKNDLDAPEILFHYTGIWAAHEIVNSHTMRATHAAYMNDGSEMSYAYGVIAEILLSQSEKYPISNSSREIVRILGRYFSDIPSDISLDSNIYITSFTSRPRSLSQYRMYGGDTGGACLGFNATLLGSRLEHPDRTPLTQYGKIKKCLYKKDEQVSRISSELLDVVKNIDRLNLKFLDGQDDNIWLGALVRKVYGSLSQIASTLKHPSFSDEDEYRAVFLRNPILIGHAGFSEKSGMLRPHINWMFGDENIDSQKSGYPPKFIESALRTLEVGPGHYQKQNLKSFSLMLYHNVRGVSVDLSDSPFRR